MIMEIVALVGICLLEVVLTGVALGLFVRDMSDAPAGAVVIGIPIAVVTMGVGLIAIAFGWFTIGG